MNASACSVLCGMDGCSRRLGSWRADVDNTRPSLPLPLPLSLSPLFACLFSLGRGLRCAIRSFRHSPPPPIGGDLPLPRRLCAAWTREDVLLMRVSSLFLTFRYPRRTYPSAPRLRARIVRGRLVSSSLAPARALPSRRPAYARARSERSRKRTKGTGQDGEQVGQAAAAAAAAGSEARR